MAPDITLVSYPKIAPPNAATAAVRITVKRLEAEPALAGPFVSVPVEEYGFMNSPGTYQIIPMNVPADPHGASSLPEKRPVAGMYFDFGTRHAPLSVGNARLFLPGTQSSLPLLLPFDSLAPSAFSCP
jgi:hypothetical protein